MGTLPICNRSSRCMRWLQTVAAPWADQPAPHRPLGLLSFSPLSTVLTCFRTHHTPETPHQCPSVFKSSSHSPLLVWSVLEAGFAHHLPLTSMGFGASLSSHFSPYLSSVYFFGSFSSTGLLKVFFRNPPWSPLRSGEESPSTNPGLQCTLNAVVSQSGMSVGGSSVKPSS